MENLTCNFIKRDSNTGVFFEYCDIFKNTFLHQNSGRKFFWWRLTYSLQRDYPNSYFENHLLQLQSVSRKRDVDEQNVLYQCIVSYAWLMHG